MPKIKKLFTTKTSARNALARPTMRNAEKEHFETKTPSQKFLKNSSTKKGRQNIPAALDIA